MVSTTDRGERDLLALWEPLWSTLSPEQRRVAQAIWRAERVGMFAWGVKSGYFLWVRTHPDEQPSRANVREWATAGAQPREVC
jgi:hypothetical protein